MKLYIGIDLGISAMKLLPDGSNLTVVARTYKFDLTN